MLCLTIKKEKKEGHNPLKLGSKNNNVKHDVKLSTFPRKNQQMLIL